MELDGTSLKDISRLDTCVTVVDASNLDNNLKSLQRVKASRTQHACLGSRLPSEHNLTQCTEHCPPHCDVDEVSHS